MADDFKSIERALVNLADGVKELNTHLAKQATLAGKAPTTEGAPGGFKFGVGAGIGAQISSTIIGELKDALGMFTAAFSEISRILKAEVTQALTDPDKYRKQKPLEQALQYAEEMGRAGIPVDREYIQQVHNHYKGINENILQWRLATREAGGRLPMNIQRILSAGGEYMSELLDWNKQTQNNRKSQMNYKLNGE